MGIANLVPLLLACSQSAARPIVLIAGAQKAGTSSLASYLHMAFPRQLQLPDKACQTGSFNETRYFVPLVSPCSVDELLSGEHPEQCGLESYIHCWSWNGLDRAIDKSPDFLFWPHVPRVLGPWLAHADTRVIVLLRDPLDRLVSDAAQSFLGRMNWIVQGDHPELLSGIMEYALAIAEPLLAVIYREGRAPDTRDWAQFWRRALRGACSDEPPNVWQAKGQQFYRQVVRPAFERAVRERRRPTMTWEQYEAAFLEEARLPRGDEKKRCWACSSDAFFLCYFSQLFLQGLYLPQLVSWMEVLGGLGEPLGIRLRIVQSESLWLDPDGQLTLLTKWLQLSAGQAGVQFPREASASAKWKIGDDALAKDSVAKILRAYRRPTRQLLLWLENHPSLTNSPFEPSLWPTVL